MGADISRQTGHSAGSRVVRVSTGDQAQQVRTEYRLRKDGTLHAAAGEADA
jgi:hypothetical protein